MVQYRDAYCSVNLSTKEVDHSTPLHGLVSILFRTATLHLSHFQNVLSLFAFFFCMSVDMRSGNGVRDQI